MNRTLVNLLVDLTVAALFVGMVATGYVLEFVLPPGSDLSLSLGGMTRHRWGDLHFGLSVGLLALVALHLGLHWRWVFAVAQRRLGLAGAPSERWRCVGLAVLLVAAAAAGVLVWVVPICVRKIADDVGPSVNQPASEESTAPPTAYSAIGFWEGVYPIFERSCLSCHGPRRQLGGFRADRRADFFGGPDRAGQVVPGDSSRSPLIAIVSGRPGGPNPDVHRLPQRDAALLRAWIDAGAEWPDRPSDDDREPDLWQANRPDR